MKLLFDENLSPRLTERLTNLFPGSRNVLGLGPRPASDERIWEHARQQGFTIVSKDNDFEQMAILRGHPPKVIWLRCGNATSEDIEQLIRRSTDLIRSFEADPAASVLVLP
ncbi:MAG: DUF5615 family PIN-like protein [Terriglobales bacterium]